MSPNKSGGSDDSSPASASGKPLKKGPWTAMEDAILTEYVKKHGEGNWNAVQKNAGLSRCGKSCRLRWANHLRPNLKKGSFSPEEERTILELHSQFGNKWARMATHLPGRTDNEIKNYWNTRIKRRQRAGLPLYPPEIQRKSSNFHHHQQQPSLSPPSPLSSLRQQTQYPSQLPPFSFDPMMNLSAATVPLLANHPHFLLSDPIHRFKRLRENGIIDAAASSSSLPFSSHFPPTPPLFDQNLHTQQQSQQPHLLQFNSSNFDFNPLPLQTTFDPNGIISAPSIPMKLELPSSQITDLSSGSLDQTDGGILESLLQEAQVTTGGDDWTKEGILTDPIAGNCSVDNWVSDDHPPGPGLGGTAQASVESAGQWDNSSPADSSIGIKIKNEQTDEISSIDDDISSLLDIIPAATTSVAEWYDDGGEMSNGQSSMTNDNITLDLQPFEPPISDAEQDWSLGYCPWNNMPRIC